jgi:hypothetical protein
MTGPKFIQSGLLAQFRDLGGQRDQVAVAQEGIQQRRPGRADPPISGTFNRNGP